MNKDLTVGNEAQVLCRFCLPLFGSIIFQQLYNLADSFVAGKFIGENALAAVGNSYEITLIFIAIAFGCNIGCSVISSQYFGAKKFTHLKTAVYTSFISSAVICIILMVSGLISGDFLLHLIKTPDEIFSDSKTYLDIYVLGLPFVFFYNICTGIFSALGDSKTPFVFLAISSISNIGADILFVKSFNMGVSGVAWATFICQGISCIFALIFVIKRLKKIETKEKSLFFDKYILIKIAKIAIPSMLQQSFISIGNILIQGVINNFGPGVIAGYSASVKLNNLVITSFTTIGNGISNFTAQNLGAKKPQRVKKGLSSGIKMVWIICIPFLVLYFFFGNEILKLFIENPSKEALSSGLLFLRILSPFYFIVSVKLSCDGVLRGAGLMNRFMVATFTDLVIRVALAFILSKTSLGFVGIWCAWPIGWTVATFMSVIFYRQKIKEHE